MYGMNKIGWEEIEEPILFGGRSWIEWGENECVESGGLPQPPG